MHDAPTLQKMKIELFKAKLKQKLAIFEGLTLTMLAQNCEKSGNDATKLRTLPDASGPTVFPF